MIRKAEPLYGAPRGNRVMKAKRITGESAQTILRRHVYMERCSVKGCKEHVCVTKHPDAMTRVRFCIGHIAGKQKVKATRTSDLLKFPWQ